MFKFNGLRQALNSLTPSTLMWKGAAFGVFLAGLMIWAMAALNLFQEDHLGASIIYFFGGILATLVLCAILFAAIALLRKLPNLYLWSMGFFFILCYFAFFPFKETQSIFVFYLALMTLASILGGAFFAFFGCDSKKGVVKCGMFFLIGLLNFLLLGYWLMKDGATFQPPLIAEGPSNIAQIDLPDPSLPGPYEVKELFYGSGKDYYRPEYGEKAALKTPTVDGSHYLIGWDSFLRTWYWGFDAKHLPLNGRVKYPKGAGPFPLVLIVHGNHEMAEFSEAGYDYLATLLASHGFIAASVDENFLNDTWFEIESPIERLARGWLLLEHLKQWRQWNQEPSHPFFQKVDMERIGLVGHSRGGKAVAIAAALNPLKYNPDDANIQFDYGFNILSLAALSPVDGYYLPGGVKINLDDVNYLALYGSHDGDVRSFGIEQYQRVHFSEASPYTFKAALYIHGANHGQFNQSWGSRDVPLPGSAFYNFGNLIPESEQKQIAKVYLSAYLKATLKNETGYIPLFSNYQAGQKWLPHTLYLNQFQDSATSLIIPFRKQLDITKIALEGGSQIGQDLEIWRQGPIRLKTGSVLGAGIFIGWNTCEGHSNPLYTINMPEGGFRAGKEGTLTISLANGNVYEEDSKLNSTLCGKNVPLDFSINLTDVNGQTAELPLSSYAFLQPQEPAEIMKSAFFDELSSTEIVFQTFEFPMQNFLEINPQFNPDALQRIQFRFDRTSKGLMILDKLGFRKITTERL